MRKEISTHTQSEERVGYSRAVRVDNKIYFSGTTAQDREGNIVGQNVYEQSKFIFDKFSEVLKGEEFSMDEIVLVRTYIVDIKQLPEFDQAFSETFTNSHPSCTLVGINQLVDPKLLIEIECIAEKG